MRAAWYIIDGYSVLHRAHPGGFADKGIMARARNELIDLISGQLPGRDVRITLVFDGQAASEEPASFGSSVELVYTGAGQTADAYVERLAGRLSHPEKAVVVSSDRAVVENAAAAGCQVMTARAFLEMLRASGERQRRQRSRSIRSIPRGPRLGDFFPEGE